MWDLISQTNRHDLRNLDVMMLNDGVSLYVLIATMENQNQFGELFYEMWWAPIFFRF